MTARKVAVSSEPKTKPWREPKDVGRLLRVTLNVYAYDGSVVAQGVSVYLPVRVKKGDIPSYVITADPARTLYMEEPPRRAPRKAAPKKMGKS